MRLLLAGKTLYAAQPGNSPDAAVGAALRDVEDALYATRPATPAHPVTPALQNAPSPRSSPVAGDRPTASLPQRVPRRRATAKKIVW